MTAMVGAHWVRAALQVNPFSYRGKNAPSTSYSDERAYNKALLDRCEQLHVALIAVTDHWVVDTAVGLIQDAEERGIVALPGFEANTAEGFHTLVIFESGTSAATVNAAIGACGVTPGCATGTVGDSFEDVLNKMTDLGALVVPSHVNVPNSGMLTGRQGNPLAKLINDPQLHAIAITPTVADAREQEAIIQRRKPFNRSHPLAVIYADDVSHPDVLTSEGGSAWFKASSPTLESLKIAVRTPETRISLSDPEDEVRPLLKELSWEGGFLDGVTIPLSSDLTALIGGPGTGKSTVIESLRFVLDLAPIGKAAKADHEAIVSNVLRSGTVVNLKIETTSPTLRTFTIERSVQTPPVVKDASGSVTNLEPFDVLGEVEIFGQHELSELTSDGAGVASMLQRFHGSTGLIVDHQDTLTKLKDNREKLARAERDKEVLEDELADIPRLEDQVRQFEETDVPTSLQAVTRLSQDEAIFDEGAGRVESVKETLTGLTDAQLIVQLGADFDNLDESPQRETLRKVHAASTDLATKLKSLAQEAQDAIESAESKIAAAKDEWDNLIRAQREEHAGVLRKLVEDGLEPDKYLTTTSALEKLKAKESRRSKLDSNIGDLLAARKKLLKNLTGHENDRAEELNHAIRTANSATNGVVVVKPVASPERQHIETLIEQNVSGQRTQIMAAIDSADFSTRTFVDAVRKGESEVTAQYSIRGAQARSLIGAGESLLRELEELAVGQAVEVLLDVQAGSGMREYRRMEDLSKGQRATALLLLLLGASHVPLIIDQPEDDLDNRFVYKGIVSHLRGLKGKRQVIVSTHNANVPVLGDAELIVALEGNGHNGRPMDGGIGSLDDMTIRVLAEKILEGGFDAFNARKHLYGF